MIINNALTSQDFCEMTVVPGIIICARSQESIRTPNRFPASNHDCFLLLKERNLLSSPIKIDTLNRSIQLTDKPLSHEYKTQIRSFRSAYTPLLHFLKKDAFTYEEAGNACTTLFFDEASNHLVAFSSIKCSSLKMKGDKILHICPSIEIMALCIDDRYRYMGIGQAILAHIIRQVYKIKSMVGVQLITLFAIPDAIAFYQKFNFCKSTKSMKIFYSSAHNQCIPMYLPLPFIPMS